MKKLERDLGLFSITSIACGAMLSGIFVLPSYAVYIGGPSAYLAFLFAGLLFIPSALSKAEMATALPESGGDYIFIDRAFGPIFSTITGFGTWLSLILKSAFALAGMSAYLLLVIPDINSGNVQYIAAFAAVILVALNCLSAKTSGQVQLILVVISVSSLLVFVERGIIQIDRSFFVPYLKDGVVGFIEATAFVFISYAGVTKIASAGEEVKNPGKNIPRGIIISLLIMMFLYTIVALVVAGVIDPSLHGKNSPAEFQNAPITYAVNQFAGEWAVLGISVVAILALLSMANAGILASSRYPFAMSRYNQLPDLFSRINSRFSTPINSILLTGTILVLSILILPVMQLAKMASVFLLIIFSIMNAAVIVFREGEIEWYNPEFYSPFYPYLQIVGISISLGLIPFLGLEAIIVSFLIIVLGLLWYYFYVRKRVTRHSTFNRNRFDDDTRPQLTKSEKKLIDGANPDPIVLIPFFNLHEPQILEAQDRLERCVELYKRTHRIVVVNIHETSGASLHSNHNSIKETDHALERYVDRLKRHGGFKIDFYRVGTNYSHELVRRYIDENQVDWVTMKWRDHYERNTLLGKRNRWFNDFGCNVLLVRTGSVQSTATLRTVINPFPGAEQSFIVETANELSRTSGSPIDLHLLTQTTDSENSRDEQLQNYFQSVDSRPMNLNNTISPEQLTNSSSFFSSDETILLDRTGAKLLDFAPDEQNQATFLHPIRPSGQAINSTASGQSISSSLTDDRIHLDVEKIYSKRALFHKIATTCSDDQQPTHQIEKSLWDTEKTYSTGGENGFLIPHAILKRGQIKSSLIILDRPIQNTESDSDVQLCFAICGPEKKSDDVFELVSLADEILSDQNTRQSLLEADQKSEIFEVLRKKSHPSPVL